MGRPLIEILHDYCLEACLVCEGECERFIDDFTEEEIEKAQEAEAHDHDFC